jgi:hypothetical protein
MTGAIFTMVAITAVHWFALSKQAITAHTESIPGDFHGK